MFFSFFSINKKKQNDVPASEREITPEEVLTWCQEFHVVSFIETSAKTSDNVSNAFVLAVREWKKSERNKDLTDGNGAIHLNQSVHLQNRDEKSCCSGNIKCSGRATTMDQSTLH